MKFQHRHSVYVTLFVLGGIAPQAVAKHASINVNPNGPLAPQTIPAGPAQSQSGQSGSQDSSFGYGSKKVDGSAMAKPSSEAPADPTAVFSLGSSPSKPGAPAAPAGGLGGIGGGGGGGGSELSLQSSDGHDSHYGSMDLVKDIKGFSDTADLKTGVEERFVDPQTGRAIGAAEIAGGRRALMITPDGRRISGKFDVTGGQKLAQTANNYKDPRYTYAQLYGASQNYIEGRVFGFKPDQPTAESAVGMKKSQMDYYAADAATIAQMKSQGTGAKIALYALKWNPGDNTYDVIGGGGGGGDGDDGKKLNAKKGKDNAKGK